jgi:hypothetical protein
LIDINQSQWLIHKTAIGVCGKNIQRVKIESEGKIIEQVFNFNDLGSLIQNEEKDINAKLQRYNKMN